VKNGVVTTNTGDNFIYDLVKNTNWMTLARFTITVKAKVSAEVLDAVQSSGENSLAFKNTAKLTMNNDSLGGKTVTAAGDVTIDKTDVITKEMTYSSGSHVKYTLEVNPNGIDLLSGPDVVTIVDQIYSAVTETGNGTYDGSKDVTDTTITAETDKSIASLETGKKNYLVVYEVGSDGSKTDITDQCVLVNTSEEDGKFTITVPDDKHLMIEYWVAFSGFVGDVVSLSNEAYFEYSAGSKETSTPVENNESFQVRSSRASGNAAPSFDLMKVDQWGNPISGVEFQLYKLNLNGDGTPIVKDDGTLDMSLVETATTVDKDTPVIENGNEVKDEDGNVVTITEGMIDFEDLEYNAIYCYKETNAPQGYEMDETLNFVEFQSHPAADTVLSTYGTVHDVVDHDAVLTVVNTFSGTSFDNLRVRKTINGSRSSTADLNFTFTLKQGENENTVYIDEGYKSAVTANGLTVNITGAGADYFDTLYFKEAGTYTFTMAESDLTQAAIDDNYTKDQSEYLVTIVVGVDEDNKLAVTSATYQQTKDSTGNAVEDGEIKAYNDTNYPIFNNTQTFDPGTVTINIQKILEGNRPTDIQEGEFTFILSRNGEKVAEGATNADGTVTLTAPLAATDANKTIYFVLQEENGTDETITYYEKPITVAVTTGVVDGTVTATNVQYQTTLNVTDDNVLEVVNTYHFQVPTGIYLNMLPYALMTAFAAGFGVLALVVRRRNHKR
jgi:pilin isopeptide linkage protein